MYTLATAVSLLALMLGTTSLTLAAHESNEQSVSVDKSLDQYLEAPDSESLSITGAITVETWFKLNSLPTGDPYAIVSKQENESNRSWFIALEEKGPDVYLLRFNIDQTGDNNTGTSVSYRYGSTNINQVGVWYHVAGTFDPSTGEARVYVNGKDDGTGADFESDAVSIYDGNASTRIGVYMPGTPRYFDGMVDEVRVWTVQRSKQEIKKFYDKTLVSAAEPTLAAYWRLEGDGADSASGNTFTLINVPTFTTDTPY